MRRTCGLLALVFLSCLPAGQAAARIWTDKKGKEIEAELVEVKSGMAVLKLENGKTIKKALGTLSEEDQEFIKENAPADTPTPKPVPKKPLPKKSVGKKPVSADPAEESEETPPTGTRPTGIQPTTTQPSKSSKGVKTTTTGVTVEVVGLSVNKALPEESAAEPGVIMPMFGNGQSGTRVNLSVSDPERQIVSLDVDKSKITACTDNTGADLNKGEGGSPSGFSPFPMQVRPGRHLGVLELVQPLTPSAGATKIRLQGEIVVQCGAGEKSAEQTDVPLKTAGKITAGPVPFDLVPADKQQNGFQLGSPFQIEAGVPQAADAPKIMVTLKTDKPIEMIKKIVFLNAAGKEISQQDLGSSSLGFGGKMSHERTIGLAEDLDKATVRIVSYEKLESISVPIDFEIGVGF